MNENKCMNENEYRMQMNVGIRNECRNENECRSPGMKMNALLIEKKARRKI